MIDDERLRDSALNLFNTGSSGELLFVDKEFKCEISTICDELFNLKNREQNEVCQMTLNFKFGNTPDQTLILESINTYQCPTL